MVSSEVTYTHYATNVNTPWLAVNSITINLRRGLPANRPPSF